MTHCVALAVLRAEDPSAAGLQVPTFHVEPDERLVPIVMMQVSSRAPPAGRDD